MIVLNELDWAYDAIQSRKLGNKPYETLLRVAKYYAHDGYSKRNIQKALEGFVLSCDPKASIPKWSKTIDYAVKGALKHPAVEMDGINVTKNEMKTIKALPGKQIRRLAFTLLCLAKFFDGANGGDHWVNCEDSEIMRLANISTSIRRQSSMYHQLWKLGLIQFSKKVDNTNVRVLFIDEAEDDVVLNVTDFRNLGYQLLMYDGEPFFKCERCGITTKIRNPSVGRKQKYCPSCATEMYIQQSINSVMRKRKAAKQNAV